MTQHWALWPDHYQMRILLDWLAAGFLVVATPLVTYLAWYAMRISARQLRHYERQTELLESIDRQLAERLSLKDL
jgi:hypothetical protein